MNRGSLQGVLKLFFKVTIFLVVVLISLLFSINSDFVSSRVIHQIESFFREEFDKQLKLDDYHLLITGDVQLSGVYLEDDFGDTLMSFSNLSLDISYWDLLNNNVTIDEVDVENLKSRIVFQDSVSNFSYFLANSTDEKESKSSKSWGVDVKSLLLSNTTFLYKQIDNGLEDSLWVDLRKLKLVQSSKNILDSIIIEKFEVKQLKTSMSFNTLTKEDPDTSNSSNSIPFISLENVLFQNTTVSGNVGNQIFFEHYQEKLIIKNGEFSFANKYINAEQISLVKFQNAFDYIGGEGKTTSKTKVNDTSEWLITIPDLKIDSSKVVLGDTLKTQLENIQLTDFILKTNKLISGKFDQLDFVFQDTLSVQSGPLKFKLNDSESELGIKSLVINGMLLEADISSKFSVFDGSDFSTEVSVHNLIIPYNVVTNYMNLPKEYLDYFNDDTLKLNAFIDFKDSLLQISEVSTRFFKGVGVDILKLSANLKNGIDYHFNNITTTITGPKAKKLFNQNGLNLNSLNISLNTLDVTNDEVLISELDLESLYGDATINGLYNYKSEFYKVLLESSKLDLGKIFKMNQTIKLEKTNLELEGNAIALNKLNVKQSGELSKLYYADTTFRNIELNTSYNGSEENFGIEVYSREPEDTSKFVASGKLNSSSLALDCVYDFRLPNINLSQLKLTENKILFSLTSKGNLSFTNSSVYQSNGSLDLNNLWIEGKKIKHNPKFIWNVSSSSSLSEVDMKLGKLELLGKIDTTINSFVQYYINAIDKQLIDDDFPNHNIVLDATKSDILKALKSEEVITNDFFVEGLKFMSLKKEGVPLSVSLALDEFKYDEFTTHNTVLEFDVDTNYVSGYLLSDSSSYNKFGIDFLSLRSYISDSIKKITFQLSDSYDIPHLKFDLNLEKLEDGYQFYLSDTLVLNKERYLFREKNSIIVENSGEIHSDFNLSTDDFKFLINADVNPDKTSNVELDLENISLDYLFDIIGVDSLSSQLSAKMNGIYDGSKLNSELLLQFDSTNYKHRFLNVLSLNAKLENTSANLNYKLNGNVDNKGSIFSEGKINYDQQTVASSLKFKNVSLSLVDFFTDEVNFDKGQFDLNGKINGPIASPNFNADLDINNSVVYIDKFNSDFTLDQIKVQVDNKGLYLNQVRVYDENEGVFKLNGAIRRLDSSFVYDLNVVCDDFTAFNTTEKDNKYFYGTLKSSLELKVNGPLNAPDVKGSVHLLKGSSFTLMSNENLEVTNDENVVRFITSEDSLNLEVENLNTGFHIGNAQIQITIDDKTTFKYVLNEEVNERVEFNGGGKLNYFSDSNGQESLVGVFNLNKGKVIIKPPVVFYREFKIDPTSKIRWDGAVENPLLDLKGIYTVRASTEGLLDGTAKRVEPFDVLIIIDDRLDKENIRFDVRSNLEDVQVALNALTEDERSMQAASLLLFGALDMSGDKSSKNTQLNNILSSQVSNYANDKIKGVEVEVDLETYNQEYASGTVEKSDLNYKIKKELGDRLILQIGGKVSTHQEANSGNAVLGDVIIEYFFNDKKRTSAKVFTENSYEGVLDGDISKAGVGVSTKKKIQRTKDIKLNNKKKQYEIKTLK